MSSLMSGSELTTEGSASVCSESHCEVSWQTTVRAAGVAAAAAAAEAALRCCVAVLEIRVRSRSEEGKLIHSLSDGKL
jgi:hypothetical protein